MNALFQRLQPRQSREGNRLLSRWTETTKCPDVLKDIRNGFKRARTMIQEIAWSSGPKMDRILHRSPRLTGKMRRLDKNLKSFNRHMLYTNVTIDEDVSNKTLQPKLGM